eukprot:TRINITY_DN6917_c0_g1_i1.p1 TRINITY_DN6917_c0_g1~~TRINITY_DN6917_c0_g1_i1.p1  ORF type:complete len:282 (+),score=41.86 TRINITY_DN6917_c0_g1_i1:249-1094(+)
MKVQGVYHAFWICVPVKKEHVVRFLPKRPGEAVSLAQVPPSIAKAIPEDCHPVVIELGVESDCGPTVSSWLRSGFHEAKVEVPFLTVGDSTEHVMFKGGIWMDVYTNVYAARMMNGLAANYGTMTFNEGERSFELSGTPGLTFQHSPEDDHTALPPWIPLGAEGADVSDDDNSPVGVETAVEAMRDWFGVMAQPWFAGNLPFGYVSGMTAHRYAVGRSKTREVAGATLSIRNPSEFVQGLFASVARQDGDADSDTVTIDLDGLSKDNTLGVVEVVAPFLIG